MTSQNQIFNPRDLAPFAPTYSHISVCHISATHDLVSFAGQVGSYESQTPATLAEQCKLAFSNVDKCLAAVNATKSDIVQVRQYVVNLLRNGQGQDPARGKEYVAWMGDLKPPSTLLGVEALASEDLLYEIEIVAVVPRRS